MLNKLSIDSSNHVAFDNSKRILSTKCFSISANWNQLTMGQKASVVLRLAMIVVCLFFMLDGRPPAHSQTNEVRDIKIAQLTDFKDNQSSWDRQTVEQLHNLEVRVNATESEIANIEGWEKGGFGVLTALSVLAMFFQLKKKEEHKDE